MDIIEIDYIPGVKIQVEKWLYENRKFVKAQIIDCTPTGIPTLVKITDNHIADLEHRLATAVKYKDYLDKICKENPELLI